MQNDIELLREAIMLLLDSVDYTAGACSFAEPVGGCLPREVIEKAREALKQTKPA